MLHDINFKIGVSDNEIVNYFKKMDDNLDGKICKQEIVDAFDQSGIDIEKEIEAIMWNLDNDRNGYIEYSELAIVLTDWSKEIKRKTFSKIFQVENNQIIFSSMKEELKHVNQEEWDIFAKRMNVQNDRLNIESFKEYIKSQMVSI